MSTAYSPVARRAQLHPLSKDNTCGTDAAEGTARSKMARLHSAVRAMAERSEEEDELARRMHQVFCLMDTDDGGTIAITEIESLMQLVGVDVSIEELEDLISEVDTDGSGELEKDEFVEMMSHKPKPPNSMQEVLRCFRLLAGKNGLGYGKIDHQVLTSQMTKIGRDPMTIDEARKLTRQLEPLKDGTINYERYVLMTLRHNNDANSVPNLIEPDSWKEQNEMTLKRDMHLGITTAPSEGRHPKAQMSAGRNRAPTECHVIETDKKIHREFYTSGRPNMAHDPDCPSVAMVQVPSQSLRGAPRVASLSPPIKHASKSTLNKDMAMRDKLAYRLENGRQRNAHANLIPHHGRPS